MKRFRNIAIAALAVSLFAAACGGDDAADTTAAPTTTEAEEMMEAGTIVEVASEAGSFATLLAAAEAAGLVDTLNGEGPFTVFAPTDEAFAALPEGTLDALLADPDALKDILLYHVVSGEVKAADVVGLESATTVQGEDIAISVDGGTVTLNGSATVVTTDIAASNGVIHVIDAVILPPSS
ncbi:MAG: fasciclin domain-containing protein [Acidimicrobiia bacterium]|nr:fasciclin domain-containing protein [Acidimicrobiia bacterium]